MRIAVISPNRNAWSETFIQAHIKRLKQVELVLTDGFLPKRDQGGNLLLGTSIVDKVKRRVPGMSVDEALRQKVKAEIKKHRIELVLAEYGPTGEAMLDICQEAGIPMVVHFHGVDAFHEKLLAEHKDYERIRSGAAAIMTVSMEMEAQLLALGTPREKLFMNYYGIDTERFGHADPAKAPCRFIAVGRFADTKAPYLTMLAFHRAWQQMPEIRLTMIGKGPLMESCLQLRTALGLQDAVDLPGVQTPEQVSEAMRSARAFVQHSVITSRGDREGTPLAVLEAMSTGLPVIATKHAGIGEVVLHEKTGLLCQERDIEAMANNMLLVARQSDQAAAMGKAGRGRVMENHQVEDRIKYLQGVLEMASTGAVGQQLSKKQ